MRVASGRRTLLGAVGGALVAVLLGGCALKGGQNISLIEGKTLFLKNCASCHTLARAGAKGVVGPNLDYAFSAALAAGEGRGPIPGIVEQQIEYPASSGVMPKLPLTTRQAADIAAYVGYAAARPGKDSGLLGAVGQSQAVVAAEKNGALAIETNPSGLLAFTAKTATATAGKLTITLTNKSGVGHNIAIQAGNSGATQASTPVLGHTPITTSGVHSFTVTLKAGVYTYYCEVPGHRQGGMWGTLTVKS
jgi:plastocyanin